MRTGPVKAVDDPRVEIPGALAFERKQRWKECSGNRYTPEELRAMAESLGRIRILEPEFQVMRLD
jgi:hypothetical protein